MKLTGFWRHFEEKVSTNGQTSKYVIQSQPTQTRQREESDQRSSFMHSNILKTKTAQREQNDQYICTGHYRSIPSSFDLSVSTLTEQREENDQDASTHAYSAISRQ